MCDATQQTRCPPEAATLQSRGVASVGIPLPSTTTTTFAARPRYSLLLANMAQPQMKAETTTDAQNIITALGKAFKGQNGAPLTGDQLALWLHQNMAQLSGLAKEGKLTHGQILAVRKQSRLLPLREFISVRALTGPCLSPLLFCFCVSVRLSADVRALFFHSTSFTVPAQRLRRQT